MENRKKKENITHPFDGDYLCKDEVAAILKIEVPTLDRWRRHLSKHFPQPKFKWGRSPMWAAEDVAAWLAARPESEAQS